MTVTKKPGQLFILEVAPAFSNYCAYFDDPIVGLFGKGYDMFLASVA